MSEIVVNLWAIYDAGSGLVYALTGRAYEMEGTDQEKLSVLSTLARHDHRMAPRQAVPSRFSVNFSDGTTQKNVTFLNTISDPNASLFESVFQT